MFQFTGWSALLLLFMEFLNMQIKYEENYIDGPSVF